MLCANSLRASMQFTENDSHSSSENSQSSNYEKQIIEVLISQIHFVVHTTRENNSGVETVIDNSQFGIFDNMNMNDVVTFSWWISFNFLETLYILPTANDEVCVFSFFSCMVQVHCSTILYCRKH